MKAIILSETDKNVLDRARQEFSQTDETLISLWPTDLGKPHWFIRERDGSLTWWTPENRRIAGLALWIDSTPHEDPHQLIRRDRWLTKLS